MGTDPPFYHPSRARNWCNVQLHDLLYSCMTIYFTYRICICFFFFPFFMYPLFLFIYLTSRLYLFEYFKHSHVQVSSILLSLIGCKVSYLLHVLGVLCVQYNICELILVGFIFCGNPPKDWSCFHEVVCISLGFYIVFTALEHFLTWEFCTREQCVFESHASRKHKCGILSFLG